MFLQFHNWHFDVKRQRVRDQKGLWITSFFRQLGFALINVFSIVFVFELGRNYFLGGGVENGLAFLISYFLVLFGTVAVFCIWIANHIISRVGYRKSILLSLGLTSIGFLSLAFADIYQSLAFIYLAAFFKGLGVCHYWVTYYTLFTDDIKTQTIGSSFGALDAFAKLGQIVAPLIGAALTVVFGYKALFLIGIVFLFLSGLPMFFLKHHLHLDNVSWKELWQWSKEARFRRLSLSLGGRAVQEKLLAIIWPVYVFLLIGTIEGMGFFQSMVLLSSAVFTYIISRFFDKHSSRWLQVVGVFGNIGMWFSRIFVGSLSQVILVDSGDRFFESLSRTFFFGYLFRRAKGKESFSFVVYWIFWDAFWLVLLLSLLLAVLFTFGLEIFWLIMVLLASAGASLSLLIQDHK